MFWLTTAVAAAFAAGGASSLTTTDDEVPQCQRPLDKVIRVAVLLPSGSSTDSSDPHNLAYHSQLERVRPVIEMASKTWKTLAKNATVSTAVSSSTSSIASAQSVVNIKNSNFTNTTLDLDEDEEDAAVDREWRVEVLAADTQCSSTHGPLKAFDFHCSAGSAYSRPRFGRLSREYAKETLHLHSFYSLQQPGN